MVGNVIMRTGSALTFDIGSDSITQKLLALSGSVESGPAKDGSTRITYFGFVLIQTVKMRMTSARQPGGGVWLKGQPRVLRTKTRK